MKYICGRVFFRMHSVEWLGIMATILEQQHLNIAATDKTRLWGKNV